MNPASQMAKLMLELRQAEITEVGVLEALEITPREMFLPEQFKDRAFENVALPIGHHQTVSQPSVVGLMTQALRLTGREKVLEVGTGSGYQAAILSLLARRVYTVDRHRRLVAEARAVFDALDLVNITAFTADGSHGLPDQAPFDRILVTAAAEDPPGPLLAQLRIGGIMVLPVGQSDTVQHLIRVTRTDQGYDYDEMRPVRFVPLVEGLAKDS